MFTLNYGTSKSFFWCVQVELSVEAAWIQTPGGKALDALWAALPAERVDSYIPSTLQELANIQIMPCFAAVLKVKAHKVILLLRPKELTLSGSPVNVKC